MQRDDTPEVRSEKWLSKNTRSWDLQVWTSQHFHSTEEPRCTEPQSDLPPDHIFRLSTWLRCCCFCCMELASSGVAARQRLLSADWRASRVASTLSHATQNSSQTEILRSRHWVCSWQVDQEREEVRYVDSVVFPVGILATPRGVGARFSSVACEYTGAVSASRLVLLCRQNCCHRGIGSASLPWVCFCARVESRCAS